ncbi:MULTISPECIES: TetR/AcrR family transcriptional regulator [Duganella]|uniref:TetR family transcriptional regulator n=2 Tax=Duganella TaxID=75654 RepID=A0A845GTX4_9BURK|nr:MULTISPECIES: TetR/AcrR family transcriptional regulator [Duganella]MYM80779.1 TetR family transcriptional regulator [Duganella lactea]MYM96117.1 TetR family transcriptional regulator [Duganella vulcania]
MARVIAEREDVIPMLGEIFRTYGFEGASLARISEGTKLGKGSIYHFFPGGKEEMAEAVLAQVDEWFKHHVFEPLVERADAVEGIRAMFDDVGRYFLSGRRVCLVGVFALGSERDRFADRVRDYFAAWIEALAAALVRTGRGEQEANALAKEVVGGIQGALVLARALDQTEVFTDTLSSLRDRLLAV